jgi:hypothetical protein
MGRSRALGAQVYEYEPIEEARLPDTIPGRPDPDVPDGAFVGRVGLKSNSQPVLDMVTAATNSFALE